MKRSMKLVAIVMNILFLISYIHVYASDAMYAKQQTQVNPVSSFFNKGKTDYLFSFAIGYDNNVWLDSERNSDIFSQTYFKPKLTSPLTDEIDGILSYELLAVMYYSESNANLVRNTFNAGVENKINDSSKLSANLKMGMADYINNGEDDFFDYALELKYRKNLSKKLFHSIMGEYMFRDYQQQKTRDDFNVITRKSREDERYTLEYEIGRYFTKDLLKGSFEFYLNDSNEKFLDYYDYRSYLPKVSLTHFFNAKTFSYSSLGYQWRDYRNRIISGSTTSKQLDKTFLVSQGVYYVFKKGLTLGATYSYRQNYSNEPVDRYSGSMISFNAYYKF